MAIKGVFFDLGGTLRVAEQVPEYQLKARNRMAELAGFDDPEAFIKMIDDRYDNQYRVWAMTENKESGDFELWNKWLLPELPKEKTEQICHEITFQYRQYKAKRHTVEGGVEVLKGLYERGYKLAIISNLIGEYEIGDWLKEEELDKYFSSVVLSSVIHIRKPDPEIYRIASRELGLEPGECVSIADNLGRDITGAKAAGVGMNVLFISEEKLKTKKITDENRPDKIVHKFIDILDIEELKGVKA